MRYILRPQLQHNKLEKKTFSGNNPTDDVRSFRSTGSDLGVPDEVDSCSFVLMGRDSLVLFCYSSIDDLYKFILVVKCSPVVPHDINYLSLNFDVDI